jgi:hypothetical protein
MRSGNAAYAGRAGYAAAADRGAGFGGRGAGARTLADGRQNGGAPAISSGRGDSARRGGAPAIPGASGSARAAHADRPGARFGGNGPGGAPAISGASGGARVPAPERRRWGAAGPDARSALPAVYAGRLSSAGRASGSGRAAQTAHADYAPNSGRAAQTPRSDYAPSPARSDHAAHADRPGARFGGSPRFRRNSKIAIVASLFLLVYIPSTFNWLSNDNVSTDILRNGELVESVNLDAVVVRDEVLVYTQSDGISIPSAGEGERVAGNAKVATVYSRASVELMDELKKIDKAILESQYALLDASAVFSQDVQAIEKDIDDVVRKMIPNLNKNSLYLAAMQTKEIDGLVAKKAEAYSALDTDDPYVSQLKSEKRAIEEQVLKVSEDVHSPYPGHVSYTLDGLEAELAYDSIPDIPAERFEAILAAARQPALRAPEYADGGIAVAAGAPFAKVVRNNYFYICASLPKELNIALNPGDKVRLRINGPSREFESAEAVYCQGGEDGEGGGRTEFAVFKLKKYLFDFINARVVNIDVIEKYQAGLKIPVKCLKDYAPGAGTASVVLLKSNNASIRKVKVLAANDVYAIIESDGADDAGGRVSLYDTYVRDTANIEEGMVLIK